MSEGALAKVLGLSDVREEVVVVVGKPDYVSDLRGGGCLLCFIDFLIQAEVEKWCTI